jgi:hypothetical protein
MSLISSTLTTNPASGIFTSEYKKPWKFKAIFKDKYNEETLYSFDQFVTNNPFAITDSLVNKAVQQTGDFSIRINDTKDRAVDRNILDCGNFVIIQTAQNQDEWQNLLYGIINQFGTTRTQHERNGVPGSGQIYDLFGQGTASIFNQRYVNVNITVPKEAVGSIEIIKNDPKYYISNIFGDIIRNPDVIPIGGTPTLETHGNFKLDRIADNIKQVIPGVSQTMVLAAQLLSFLAEAAGAIWGVDEENYVYLKYPSGRGQHTGITVKSLVDPEDLAQYTSYALGPWNFVDSMKPEDGFANRLLGVAANIDAIVSGVFDVESYTSLYHRDLYQQIIPGAARFRDLVLTFSKTGAGTNAPNPIVDTIECKIVKDDGADHPSKIKLGTFNIPVKDIGDTPTAVYITNLNLLNTDIDPLGKYWICVKAIGNSEENTCRLWHNNDYSIPQELASGFRQIYLDPREISFDSKDDIITSLHGPNYTFAITTKLRRVTEVSDPLSILRWTPRGPVEALVNVSWIKDAQTMNIYLNSILQFSAKLQRQYNYNVVTIPTQMFRVGTFVNIEDHILPQFSEAKSVMAEIGELSFAWSGSALTNQGIDEVVIRPKGFVSPDTYKLIDDDDSLEVIFTGDVVEHAPI